LFLSQEVEHNHYKYMFLGPGVMSSFHILVTDTGKTVASNSPPVEDLEQSLNISS
jgi:hypothetical protein